MKPEHLHILQHSLGVNQYGKSEHRANSDDWHGCYRNSFVTGPGCRDYDDCRELVALGFMCDHGTRKVFGDNSCFSVTEAGYQAMRDASPAPPKLSRSQQRYRDYRAMDGVFDTFKDYLGYLTQKNKADRLGFSGVSEMEQYFSNPS